MQTLVPIGTFEDRVRRLLGKSGFDDMLEFLARRPKAGRVIQDTGGLRKVRMARPGRGNGAKSMGEELANSDAFASCQVKKVFRAVCLRDAEDQIDRNAVAVITASFRSGYNMKQVFADSAVHCMGQ